MTGVRIAVDAMGGDHAPYEIVAGCYDFARSNHSRKLLLFGEEAPLAEARSRIEGASPDNIEYIFCGPSVGMCEPPVDALRVKRHSSIMKAVTAVSDGAADAFISAGNTGVCVAATTLKWRLLPGIPKAGIAVVIPSANGPMVALDLGANVAAKPDHLFGYAVMGAVYSNSVLGIKTPRISLLNVGEEEGKGNKLVGATRDLLKMSSLNFIGHVEGNHLFEGRTDVLVCDGFSGNLILKTAEGVAEFMTREIRNGARRSPFAMLGGMLMRGVFKRLKARLDYTQYGGAQLLGVNGVCIISHGRSDRRAVYNALRVGADIAEKDVNKKIVAGMVAESVAVPVSGDMP